MNLLPIYKKFISLSRKWFRFTYRNSPICESDNPDTGYLDYFQAGIQRKRGNHLCVCDMGSQGSFSQLQKEKHKNTFTAAFKTRRKRGL